MTDLSKEMPCETMSDPDFMENQTKQSALINSTVPSTAQEKGFLRQRTNSNNVKERTEKILRAITKTSEDNAVPIDESRFTLTKKDTIQRNLRALLGEIQRQEEFYMIADRHGYHVAEKCEQFEMSGSIGEGTSKILAEVMKSENSSPRKFFPGGGFGRTMQRPMQPFATNNPQTFSSYAAAPQIPQYPPYQQQQFATGPVQQLPTPPNIFPPPAMGPRAPYPGAAGKRPRMTPDKRNSLCFTCNMVGHWSGDPECPLVAGGGPAPGLQLPGLGPQPPPPGSI